MQKIRTLYRGICRAERTLSMLAMVGTTLLIFVASVIRSFDFPLNAALEISQFLFAWCVFLSADVALRENRLVSLDMLTSRLSQKGRALLSIFTYGVILVFLAVMAYYGYILTWETRVRSFLGMPNFSYAWVTLSLPLAFTLMAVTVVLKLRGFFSQLSSPPSSGDSAASGQAAGLAGERANP